MAKLLLVTGAASGIGAATAQSMAEDGWAVALLDRDMEGLSAVAAEIANQGGTCRAYPSDVTDLSGLKSLADRVMREMGPVQALVTSAGIINNSQTVLDMDVEEHDRVWKVNYFGTLHTIRAFAPQMIGQGAGSIVTLGSITGMGAFPLPAYSPSKTAIMRLTQILAVELGRDGVRVNGVAPTYVLTPTIQARVDAGLRDLSAIRDAGALNMVVKPQHIADAIAYLCSDKAAAITGVMLPVDAGWDAARSYKGYAGGVPWDDET